ncbi:MAG: hypothetical protein RR413_12425 [Christensenellaceae bacterium]
MKRILLSIFTLIGIFALAGCQHTHQWVEATCISPKTCSTCDETEGEALGHQWIEATCTAPKMCSVCHTTEGSKKAHTVSSGEGIPKCTECNEFVVELTAKDVQYDMGNNVNQYFTLNGYAELDDYYNYGFDSSIEQDYFCLNVTPTGGGYTDQWYIYCHRNSFQKVLDKAKDQGGIYVDMICMIPSFRFEKNQQNMANLQSIRY